MRTLAVFSSFRPERSTRRRMSATEKARSWPRMWSKRANRFSSTPVIPRRGDSDLTCRGVYEQQEAETEGGEHAGEARAVVEGLGNHRFHSHRE